MTPRFPPHVSSFSIKICLKIHQSIPLAAHHVIVASIMIQRQPTEVGGFFQISCWLHLTSRTTAIGTQQTKGDSATKTGGHATVLCFVARCFITSQQHPHLGSYKHKSIYKPQASTPQPSFHFLFGDFFSENGDGGLW